MTGSWARDDGNYNAVALIPGPHLVGRNTAVFPGRAMAFQERVIAYRYGDDDREPGA